MPENTAQTQTASWCPTDGQIVEPVAVYECSRCGGRSEERRCGQCHIFMARAEGDGCPDCFGEVEDCDAVEDHDGTLILVENYDPDGPSLNERIETQRAIDAAQRAADAAAKKAELDATSITVPWGQVTAGTIVLLPDVVDLTRYREATVVDTFVAGPDARGVTPGTVLAVLDGAATRVTANSPDAVALVKPGEQHSPEISPTAERYDLETDAPGLWGGSGPRAILVSVGNGDQFTLGGVPVAALMAVRGNMGSPLGAFHDAADARAFAAVAREAADALPDDGGRRAHDKDVTTSFETAQVITANLSRWAKFRVGHDGDQALVEMSVSERHGRSTFSTAFTDRLSLLALADAADQAAVWLDEQYGTACS